MRANGSRTSLAVPRHDGFTLIEMMMVLIIVALVVGVAVPGMRDTMNRTRAVSAMMELHALINLARQTAITRNSEITVCGVDGNLKCTEPWDGNPTLVFEDTNRNRSFDQSEFIAAETNLTRSGRIRWQASGGRDYLRFRFDGSAKEFGSFYYCVKSELGAPNQKLVISANGRARRISAIQADNKPYSLACH